MWESALASLFFRAAYAAAIGLGGAVGDANAGWPPAGVGDVRSTCGAIGNGTADDTTAIADGGKVQIYWGTGSASANGTTCSTAGTTRNAVGGFVQCIAATTAEKAPFSLQAIVTGLTVGTTYWYDACLAAITGGTATINDVSISAFEL